MGCTASTEIPFTPACDGRESQPTRVVSEHYDCFDELQYALRREGLVSTNLIIAVDYTRSNMWTGKHSFGGRCLHAIDPDGLTLNPYQSVIDIVGRILQPFSGNNLIPTFGFGDSNTADRSVFSFLPDGSPCRGVEHVLSRYDELTPHLSLGGPTNFAPIIYHAIRLVKAAHSYHVLVIIADGQVTNEKETSQAIVEASKYALSIVVVGVGDGPWEQLENYSDALPTRRFENFQFLEYNRVMGHNSEQPDLGFATAALSLIPDQLAAIRKLGLLQPPVSSMAQCSLVY